MAKLRRRSIRLPDYDYAQEGAYFVTLCACKRECLFGEVDNQGAMRLNALGEIVKQEWLQTSFIRPNVILDEYVIMPNHFHAIMFLVNERNTSVLPANHPDTPDVGARRAVPLHPKHRKFGESVAGSLPTIVGAFKSAATKRINEHRHTPGAQVWQRNYHEHIIRNESALHDIRSYIQTNPARWTEDLENPANRALEKRIYP